MKSKEKYNNLKKYIVMLKHKHEQKNKQFQMQLIELMTNLSQQPLVSESQQLVLQSLENLQMFKNEELDLDQLEEKVTREILKN